MSSIGQGVGQNPLMQMQWLQAMFGGMGGGQQQGSMNPPPSSLTPFTQPMGTTLNSMGSPALRPAPTPGQINPPQGAAASGMNNFQKGAQQLMQGLRPPPAQSQPMSVPNLQIHQPGAGANPQMLQQMLASGRFGMSLGGGGPFGDTQGYGYA